MSKTDTETRKQQVNYELVVVDELPPRTRMGGGNKSILNEQLGRIEETQEWHGKPVRIGLYVKGTAATAAKNVLQQRKGRTPAVLGWKFETRRVPNDPNNPEAGTQMGLFAIYTPEKIVDGAYQAHEKAEEVRKAKLEAAREAEVDEDEEGEDEEEEEEEDEEEYEDEAEEVEVVR